MSVAIPNLPIYDVLPVEVIVRVIHAFLASHTPHPRNLLLFCQLDSTIRRIALGEPTLWTSIYADLGCHGMAELCPLWLERSHSLPISLTLSLVQPNIHHTGESLSSSLGAMIPVLLSPQCVARFRTLEVAWNIDVMRLLLHNTFQRTPTPSLEELRLCIVSSPPISYLLMREIPLTNLAPNLRCVHLEGCLLSLDAGPLDHVKFLKIVRGDMSFSTPALHHTLMNLPGLEELHFEGPEVTQGDDGSCAFVDSIQKWPSGLLPLHHLRVLSIVSGDVSFVRHILSHLETPNLEELQVDPPLPDSGIS